MPPPLSALPSYAACTGRLAVAGLSVPATLYLMKTPRSYTREDVVEFHVGAWPAVVPEIVSALVAVGARPAEAGEFTFRALASGRLDLAQAEGVAAVIDAADRAALRAAEDLLGGHLSAEIGHLADEVRMALALVEVGLDFSDQERRQIEPLQPPARRGAGDRLARGRHHPRRTPGHAAYRRYGVHPVRYGRPFGGCTLFARGGCTLFA
jgi:hypothetical protein